MNSHVNQDSAYFFVFVCCFCSFLKTGFLCGALTEISLSLPLKCWDSRCEPPAQYFKCPVVTCGCWLLDRTGHCPLQVADALRKCELGKFYWRANWMFFFLLQGQDQTQGLRHPFQGHWVYPQDTKQGGTLVNDHIFPLAKKRNKNCNSGRLSKYIWELNIFGRWKLMLMVIQSVTVLKTQPCELESEIYSLETDFFFHSWGPNPGLCTC